MLWSATEIPILTVRQSSSEALTVLGRCTWLPLPVWWPQSLMARSDISYCTWLHKSPKISPGIKKIYKLCFDIWSCHYRDMSNYTDGSHVKMSLEIYLRFTKFVQPALFLPFKFCIAKIFWQKSISCFCSCNAAEMYIGTRVMSKNSW